MSQNNKFQKTVAKIGIVLGALSLLAIVVVACDAGGSSGGGSGGETVGEAIDCTTDANTACSFDVGDTFEGGKGTAGDDGDWIGVMLAADTTYRIGVEPTDDSATATVAVYSGTATAATPIIGADNLWTPTAGRNYYISVVLSAVGEYTLSVAAAPDAGGDACNGTDAEGDCDGDEVLNEDDEFDFDMDKSCTIVATGVGANRDSAALNCDNDTYANADDTCPALAHADNTDTDDDRMGNVCDPDDDGDLVLDSDDDFALNACASVDTDDDMAPDEIIDPTAADAGRCSEAEAVLLINLLAGLSIGDIPSCATVATVAEYTSGARVNCTDTDADDDGVADDRDVDLDNDGLIEIATAAQLNNMRHNLAGTSYDDEAADSGTGDVGSSMGCPSGGCNGYELVADIDLATANSGMYANWVPIGSSDTSTFTATFDGNGRSIVGLAISTNSGTRIGLFGSTGVLALAQEIRNLHIAGTIDYTGSTNSVRIGGLVGGVVASSSIHNCSAAVNITGGSGINQNIGGLVGNNQIVENSWASGTVSSGSGTAAVGGLVGFSGGRIRNSFATGAVSGNAPSGLGLGGLVGVMNDPVVNSWASGTVTGGSGDDVLGGLIGWNSDLGGTTSLTTVYASGAVDGGDGSDTIGGLVGNQGFSNAATSYYSGTVDGAGGTAVGTLIGSATLTNVVGLTSAQLQGATAAGATISPAVDGTNMLACIAAGGTFTASAGGTPASCAGQATTVYVGWSTNNWHFGTASEWPALRSFVDNNGDGDNADAGEQGAIICGQPAPRATRPECTGALVPLP